MGAGGQGNGINNVGAHSSVGGAGSTLELVENWVCAGCCDIAVGIGVMPGVAL